MPGPMHRAQATPEMKKSLKKGTLGRLFKYLFQNYKGMFFVVIGCVLFSAVCGLAASVFLQYLSKLPLQDKQLKSLLLQWQVRNCFRQNTVVLCLLLLRYLALDQGLDRSRRLKVHRRRQKVYPYKLQEEIAEV